MKNYKENIFTFVITLLAWSSVLLLGTIIFFISSESRDFFSNVSIGQFLFGQDWNPISNPPSFSILPMILATVYTSVLAVVIALPVGIGCAVFIATCPWKMVRGIMKWWIDLLAGVPSVIIGLIGLSILVKLFEVKFSFSSGECVFIGSVVLAVMVLPYIISTCEESMNKTYIKYKEASLALSVSKWYMVRWLILETAGTSIIVAVILAIGRAMGETMAVMMVIGNAHIMPRLFGKAQTISSLIALEMGAAQINSLHYHALYAAGFVLMILLIFLNFILYSIKKLNNK